MPQASHTTNNLRSVGFVTPQIGWAAGDKGTILHTQDGGQTWVIQITPTKHGLLRFSIHFPAVGMGGRNRFPHHPAHRRRRAALEGTMGWPADSYLLSHLCYTGLGWAVGYEGTILHTTDGGRSWHPQSSGTTTTSGPWHRDTRQDGSSETRGPSCKPKTGVRLGGRRDIVDGRAMVFSGRGSMPGRSFRWNTSNSTAGGGLHRRPDRPRQPVVDAKADALGYLPLVRRLRYFIQNPTLLHRWCSPSKRHGEWERAP